MRLIAPIRTSCSRVLLALAGGAALAACAPARGLSGFTPADIPRLQADLRRDATDPDVMVRLGAAYREAGRLGEAEETLRRSLSVRPRDPGATLYLGLTLEDAERFGEARELYQQYLEVSTAAGLRDRISSRLAVVRRLELQQSARAAVAREAEVADTPPRPGTVAVFPFQFTGGSEELRPLERALADMLVTDLAQTERLQVLERLQVQMLLDEMRLGASGLTETRTAARTGRLLGAERVVQGAIWGDQGTIELEAAVVRVGAGAARPEGTVAESDAVDRLFDVEKRLALGIYEEMGIQLTPTERERVNRRPTENLQALLAYGLGLEALDAGDFETAAREFSRALSFDANFSVARARLATAMASEEAANVTTREIAQEATVEIAEPVVALEIESEAIIPSIVGRDPVSETLGTEGIGQRTILDIIIRRP